MFWDMADFLDHDWCVQQLSIMLHVFIYALRVIPGGNQVDGLPPASSIIFFFGLPEGELQILLITQIPSGGKSRSQFL